MRYNPPPNWPPPPPGWTPPPGWSPPTEWGPAPAGWSIFVDDAVPPAVAPTGYDHGYGSSAGAPPAASPAAPKRKHTGRNLLVGAVLLLLLLVACVNAISGGGGDEAVTEASTTAPTSPDAGAAAPTEPAPTSEAPETSEEPAPTSSEPSAAAEAGAFAGQTDSDTVVAVGETANVDNTAVTVSPLEASSGPLDGDLLCSDVSIVNNDDDTLSFSPFSFELQNPQGAAVSATFLTSDGATALPTGDLAPGGSTAGEVCFNGPAVPGQNVLLYAPLSFTNTERGAFLQTF